MMKLSNILEGTENSSKLFVNGGINALENRICEQIDKKTRRIYCNLHYTQQRDITLVDISKYYEERFIEQGK